MTPAEIIARAYDREQAAQMGEPDPWQYPDPTEEANSFVCGQAAVDRLLELGWRLVAPGELDGETLEKAAAHFEKGAEIVDRDTALAMMVGCYPFDSTGDLHDYARRFRQIAAAIRSMGKST